MRSIVLVALCAALSACAGMGEVASASDCGTTVVEGAAPKQVVCPRPGFLGMDGAPVQ